MLSLYQYHCISVLGIWLYDFFQDTASTMLVLTIMYKVINYNT